jgi:transposase
MKQTDKRKLSHSAKEALRRQAMQMHFKQGMRISEIMKTLQVGRTALSNWKNSYKKTGMKGLKSNKKGRPKEIRLNKEQIQSVKKWLKDKLPEQLKLPYGLWTREAVQMLIKRKFRIKISITTSGRYLEQWGFSPQKPVYKAYEQDSKEVRDWLEKDYPKIKRKAKKEKAEIHWGDETGMRSDHQAGRSYAPKGKTPVIKKSGKRFKINMISSLTNRGTLEFMVYRTGFNTEVFILFMKQLIKHSRQKIFLIVDRHPAHKTKRVEQWLEENKEKISLYYLPAYSPELNPDELVNQDIKTNIIGKKRPHNVEQMEKNVKTFMKHRRKNAEQVKKYFHKTQVRYAA